MIPLKRSNDETQAPNTAIIPQLTKKTKKGTAIFLPDDILRLIVTFVDSKDLPPLACACKTTRDAALDEDMLARDKVYMLRCFLALNGKEDALRRKYCNVYDEDGRRTTRESFSDDVSEWWGVTVWGGRVTAVDWTRVLGRAGESLTGTIPAEIGALSALTWKVETVPG